MIPSLATYDFLSILTPILLAFAALGAMVLDALGAVAARFVNASALKYRAKVIGVFTLVSLIVILIAGWIVGLPPWFGSAVPSAGAFFGQVLPDGYTLFFNTLFFIAALAATILSLAYWDASMERGEYYILRNPQANTYLKIDPLDYFAPMLVPPMLSMGTPLSSRARMQPIWANPQAAPPLRTRFTDFPVRKRAIR